MAAAVEDELVLVVDDDDAVRMVLERIVKHAGYTVDLARSVSEARDLVSLSDYGCVLLDKNLPDGSGIDLLPHIKERRPDSEVIIVTGYANLDSVIQALRLGAFDYVTKPFEDIRSVSNRIAQALERRRLRMDVDRLVGALRAANTDLASSRQGLKNAYVETVFRLSIAAEYKDTDTAAHIKRMSQYAAILARALGQSELVCEQMTYAAPMHDIGKIGIPDHILRKPGKLTPDELEIMKQHTVIGARILEGSTADVLMLSREIALCHHEKWDGSGYPGGLREDAIPLSGRIVALADTFDALVNARCYKPAFPVDESVAWIESMSGKSFDPRIVECFHDNLPAFRAILPGSG